MLAIRGPAVHEVPDGGPIRGEPSRDVSGTTWCPSTWAHSGRTDCCVALVTQASLALATVARPLTRRLTSGERKSPFSPQRIASKYSGETRRLCGGFSRDLTRPPQQARFFRELCSWNQRRSRDLKGSPHERPRSILTN